MDARMISEVLLYDNMRPERVRKLMVPVFPETIIASVTLTRIDDMRTRR